MEYKLDIKSMRTIPMRESIRVILLLFSVLITFSCSQQLTVEEYIQSGQDKMNEKNWGAAIIEFKNAVKQSPDNAKVRVLLAKIYLKTFSSDAAIKEITRSIDLGHDKNSLLVLLGKAYLQKNDSKNILTEISTNNSQSSSTKAAIHALRAEAYLKIKKITEAKVELDKAKSLDESNADVRLAWAQYEKISSNISAQREWLRPLIENGEGLAEAWSQIAQIEQLSGNNEAAENAYTKAIKTRGIIHIDVLKRALLRITQKNFQGSLDDINILKKAGVEWPMVGYAEGLVSYYKNEFDIAQSLFENVLSKSPDYMPARLLVGLTHFNKKNYQSSIVNLDFYLTRFPDAFQANFIYAASLLKLNKSDEAISILQKLDKLEPNNFKLLSLLANAYLINMQQEKSVQVLNRAVELEPSQARIRLQLGSVLLRENSDLEDAQQQLIKAIELDPELFQADYALHMSYMRTKKFKLAREVSLSLKRKQPDDTLGSNLEAMSYMVEGDKTKAISVLKEILKNVPADPTSSNNLARIYLQDKRVDEAKDIYLSVLQKFPTNLKSINQLALIEAKANNPEKVLEWLKLAVEKNPDALSAKLLLATQYLRKNEPAIAIKLLRNAKIEDKKKASYIMLLAKAKMGVKEYQHATASLKSLVSKRPELSSAYFLLAQSYAYQSNKIKMRESLNSTIKLVPEHLSANLMLARLDLLERKVDDFKERVDMLFKMYPDNNNVQLLYAKAQSSDKSYDSAIKTLKALMSEAPRSEVIIDLSKNQWNHGDKEGAISSLEIWLQGNKEDKNALMLLSQYYLGERRATDAKNTYLALDKLLPNNSVVLNNLAWLMLDSNVEQGIIYAKKALILEPENPLIEDTLAMLLLEKGDNADALIHSQIAANKLPNVIDIQFNYAKVLIVNNQKDKAKMILQNLLAKSDSYDKRKVISKELNKI